jgi:anti-sigma factor RsiW
MTRQHLEEEIYLDYLTGELSAKERLFLEGHLDGCSECRLRFEQCRELLRGGLPSIADEMADDLSSNPLPWSLEEGEKRLYEAIEKEYRGDERSRDLVLVQPLQSKAPQAWLWSLRFSPRARVGLAIAASVVVAVGLADSLYRLGVKHGLEQSRATAALFNAVAANPAPTAVALAAGDAVLLGQLHKLALERDVIQASLLERDAQITRLKGQIEQQRKQSEATEASFHLADLQAKEQTQQISAERDDLARKLEDQQVALAATQKKFDALQQAGTNDTLRVASLENRIQQVTQLLKDKDATIDEQQRFLASDRDIRELMGARDLYISEAYDVGVDGKRKKGFTRVFLTKGKSLIFYGYDLDQQPGIKNASTFQAWGMRGPDRNTALNLGVMKLQYVDNSANRRWVLQLDDPKLLEQINAVFITVEPKGESRVPQGTPRLVTYLKEVPNHP